MKERAAGHVARREEIRNAYSILALKPGGTGPLEKFGFSGSISNGVVRKKEFEDVD
jgi:hypothetical protein